MRRATPGPTGARPTDPDADLEADPDVDPDVEAGEAVDDGAGRSAAPTGRVLLGVLVLLAASTAAWWLLAPQPPVVTDGAQRVSPGLPELAAAQDGVFVLVTAVAGVLTGLGLVGAGPTAGRVVVVLVASLGSSWATALLGATVGDLVAGPRRAPALPDGVEDQLAQGVEVVPSQLVLSSDVALVVWPLLAALVVTAVLIGRLLRAPGEPVRTGRQDG